MAKFLIQMSGVPGSGKSTVARKMGLVLSAVILDHDDMKTAILDSGVSETLAGAASYSVIKALSSRLLEEGNSVIIDSPCLYTELVDHGISAAKIHGAEYRYIECQLGDLSELDRRLRSRTTRPSQIQSLDQEFSHAGKKPRLALELIKEWASGMKRPPNNYLQLDTSNSLEECTSTALEFIRK